MLCDTRVSLLSHRSAIENGLNLCVCCEIPVAAQADESPPRWKSKSPSDGAALTLGADSTC